MSLIQVKKLKKYFDMGKGNFVHALDDVSLEIFENEILGLVGESGSGKSTFGKVLAGLHEKTSGEVLYKGDLLPSSYKSSDFLRLSKDIQMIFQDPYSSLNPRMTVEEIVGEGLALRGERKDVIQEKVKETLVKVGLGAEHMSRFPHEFSGGQRQRIGIARAMIVEPSFLICDEPISALDVSVQAQVVNLLEELKRSFGLTLLFIAHDLSMVRYISDRIAVMYLGVIVELGPANEVFFDAKHPYSQLLIESNPIADPKVEKARAHTPIKGEIPSPVNVQPGCRFYGRCPQAMDRCLHETPKLQLVGEGHEAACHLFDNSQ